MSAQLHQQHLAQPRARNGTTPCVSSLPVITVRFNTQRPTIRCDDSNAGGTAEILKVEISLEQRLKAIDAKDRPALRALIESGLKLPAISPDDLRHTCGSLWLRNRRPIEVVSRDLGYQDINVTYKIDRHVLESEREQHVMDLFELRKSA